MKICESFNSIDGEVNGFTGPGQVTTFVRLHGCNLNCKWCDTPLARDLRTNMSNMSVDEVIERIGRKKVTITGGEPLLQLHELKQLVNRLLCEECKITIETNGSLKIPKDFVPMHMRMPGLRFVVDYKLPSSGMQESMDYELFDSLPIWDVIKFVVADQKDLDVVKELLKTKDWRAQKAVGPVLTVPLATYDEGYEASREEPSQYEGLEYLSPRELAQTLIDDPLFADVQFNLQLHKILGVR